MALAIGMALPGVGFAADWPQWRGPAGNGTSPETGLPSTWSTTENVSWRLALPGPAGSTPAVSKDRIYLTSADGESVVLICASTAGKELWRRTIAKGNKTIRKDEGNWASPSPATDGQHVWAFFGNGDLVCYTSAGKLVWKTNTQKLYGDFDHWHGMASSPLLVDDKLVVMCVQIKNSYVVALDKLTGTELWKHSRDTDADHESKHSYASPVLYEDGSTRLLLIHGGDYTTAHSLGDGKEIWRCGSLNPKSDYNRFLRFVASPTSEPGLVVVPSAKNHPILGIDPAGKGNLDGTKHVSWRLKRGTSDVPTPTLSSGLVYNLRENGVLICIDAKGGEKIYEQRIHRTRQRASPVLADGKLYVASRDGEVFVIKEGREFEVLAKNTMGEEITATPAIAGGRVYLRTWAALYAIEAPRKAASGD